MALLSKKKLFPEALTRKTRKFMRRHFNLGPKFVKKNCKADNQLSKTIKWLTTLGKNAIC